MAVHEVLVANSVKKLLTHTCPNSEDKKQVIAVPWGTACPNAPYGCKFENPPRNKFTGEAYSSTIMTDGQIAAFEKKWGKGFLRFPDREAAAAKAAQAKTEAT